MGNKLKICMVTTFYPPYNFGGDGIYIYRMSNELAKRGHHVDVINCIDAYSLLEKNGPKGNYPNHQNINVFGLKSRAGFLSPFLTQQTGLPFFKKHILKRKLERNGYDVIHYHNMSLIGITALRYGSAVKLYTTHEHWLICPMHVLWRYNREVCQKRTCITCQLAGRRPPQLWRYTKLLKRMLENVDLFISPSRFTRMKHLEQGLKIPITHLPYFLPKTEKKNVEISYDKPFNHERPYFLFVGRLEKIKGLQNLIPVFKKNNEYDLLVAGDGEYGAILEKMAVGANNVKFLGRLNHKRLQALYSQAVAVIVPSICYEVFGIIIIEAFSMKTPVIVNNLGAMPEVVHDSGGGYVYNNENELIRAMETLVKQPKIRNELGEKGYRAYLKYWSEDSHIDKYLSLINGIQEKKLLKRRRLNANTYNRRSGFYRQPSM